MYFIYYRFCKHLPKMIKKEKKKKPRKIEDTINGGEKEKSEILKNNDK